MLADTGQAAGVRSAKLRNRTGGKARGIKDVQRNEFMSMPRKHQNMMSTSALEEKSEKCNARRSKSSSVSAAAQSPGVRILDFFNARCDATG